MTETNVTAEPKARRPIAARDTRWAARVAASLARAGVTPNQIKTLTKYVGTTAAQSNRPYFKIMGRSISDSGGDFWCVIYRAKATDNLEGEMADGQFFLTGASDLGYKSNEASTLNRVWQWVQNETETPLP